MAYLKAWKISWTICYTDLDTKIADAVRANRIHTRKVQGLNSGYRQGFLPRYELFFFVPQTLTWVDLCNYSQSLQLNSKAMYKDTAPLLLSTSLAAYQHSCPLWPSWLTDMQYSKTLSDLLQLLPLVAICHYRLYSCHPMLHNLSHQVRHPQAARGNKRIPTKTDAALMWQLACSGHPCQMVNSVLSYSLSENVFICIWACRLTSWP